MDRTFGVELEFMNIVKDQVILPDGYKWSPDEMWIINTDGSKATPSAKRGGEINTRPLYWKESDLQELEQFIHKSFNEWGGSTGWYQTFDLHVDISDIKNVEDLKKFSYACLQLMGCWHELVNLPDYTLEESWSPIMTEDEWQRAQQAKTLEQLRNVYANSSIRGHRRHNLNINPYWRIGTVEFRSFAASQDWEKIKQSIRFCIELCDFIVGASYDEISRLSDIEWVRAKFKLVHEFEKYPPPLIFAEDHKILTSYKAKAIPLNKKLISTLKLNTGREVNSVNPFKFAYELSAYKEKKLTIYSNSEFDRIVFDICRGQLEIQYTEHLAVLNEHKDQTAETELALFYIFQRIHKYRLEDEYGAREFLAHASVIDQSVCKLGAFCREMVAMADKVKLVMGTLFDALETGQDTIYQQELDSKANSAVSALKKYSDYVPDYEKKQIDFSKVRESTRGKLLIVSRNDFLDYHKIAKDQMVSIYSNEKGYAGVKKEYKESGFVNVEVPKDDFLPEQAGKIRIIEMRPTEFEQLQERFIKKVTKVKGPRICYVVLYEELMLGGFGFDYPKQQGYDLFLLTDFCTNNNVKQLSKLILFLAKTKEVKKLVERKINQRVSKAYTKVYTTMPVSMKYRGALQKVEGEKGKYLLYEMQFGSMSKIGKALKEYKKRLAL